MNKLFHKMNFKILTSFFLGLASFAAGQFSAPENPATGIWIQQIGEIVPHAETKGTLYYTKYYDTDRVKSIDYQYDGAGYLLMKGSSKKTICTQNDGIQGGEGIVLHHDGDLLVAAQGKPLHKVNKTAKDKGGKCLVKTSYARNQADGFWHLMMDPNGENLWATGIPGYLYRFSTMSDSNNSNFASTGYKVELKPRDGRNTDRKLATMIWDGDGTAFFTHSDYFGGGCEANYGTRACTEDERKRKNNLKDTYFGVITDTVWATINSSNKDRLGGKIGDRVIDTLGTRILIDSLEGAHGGVYDPYSNTIFVFGGARIVQIQPYREGVKVKAKVVATIDMREYLFEENVNNLTMPRTQDGAKSGDAAHYPGVGWRLDQGAADGLGHLFVTSNTGHIIFVDFAANPQKCIDDDVLIHVQWIDNYLTGLALSNESLSAESHEVSANTPPAIILGEFPNVSIPTFHIRVVAPFEFEIVMDESLPSLAKQYAVMDMMGHVLSAGELSEKETRVHVSARGAYVVRVGLGYKRVNVK